MSWLLATFKVLEGREDEFEGIMRDLIAQVRANEPGALTYTLVKSKKEPGEYIMIENYASREARELHAKTDYIAAAVPKFMACLDGTPSIKSLDVIA